MESNKLIQKIAYDEITHEEALERIISIHDNIAKILSEKTLTPNQVEVLSILFMVDEIFTRKIKFVKVNDEGVLDVFKTKIC